MSSQAGERAPVTVGVGGGAALSVRAVPRRTLMLYHVGVSLGRILGLPSGSTSVRARLARLLLLLLRQWPPPPHTHTSTICNARHGACTPPPPALPPPPPTGASCISAAGGSGRPLWFCTEATGARRAHRVRGCVW